MFFIGAITSLLIALGVVAFIYGTVRLSMYAFRISTGRGIATLLFPPYTAYFTFSELHEEEKAIPAAAWMFGIVVTALMLAIFWQPISYVMTGQGDKLEANTPGQVASEKYGSVETDAGTTGEEESSDEAASDEGEGASDEEESSDEEASGEEASDKEESDKEDSSGDEGSEGEKEESSGE
jgi:hypothetical protein